MRRPRRSRPSLRAAVITTTTSLALQWFIVVTGATVRVTGSGLGCPDWPTCTDARAVPAIERHALIEFLNRMVATPTLIAAIAACWVAWRLTGPARRDLRVSTSLVVAGVLLQAAIGAVTVLLELPPEIVAVHFLVSIGLLALATFAAIAARTPGELRWRRAHGGGRHAIGRPGARLVLVSSATMLVSLLAVIVAGVLTTASGPHSGAAPTGLAQVDRLGLFDIAVTVHARGAYAFLVLVLALTWWRWRGGDDVARPLRDLGVVLGLVVVQISLGELQYRTGLPWQVVLAHVANAALLWTAAVRVAVHGCFAPAPRAAGAGGGGLPPAPTPAVRDVLVSSA